MKTWMTSALFAGVAAGLIAALLQFLLLQPRIVMAELYESGEMQHFAGVAEGGHDHASHDHATTESGADHDHDTADAAHDHGDGAGGSPLQRQGRTVLMSLLTWCGYGLILAGGMRLAMANGATLGPAQAVLWGVGGFAAFQMMPALGMAPELPGMAGGDLAARQAWWLVTAVATAAGLWTLAYGGALSLRVMGLVLLAAPHLWGAPQPAAFEGTVPPELAATFAAESLGVGLVTWAALGLILHAIWSREARA